MSTGVAMDQMFQTRRTIILSMIIGAGGILVLGIQPLLLGSLLQQGLIDTVQLGWIATAEVLSMAAGVLVGTYGLRGRYARAIAIGAGILMALCNALTPAGTGSLSLGAARSLAGLSEGVMVAVAILTITYSVAPGRLNAIYLTAGATPQLILAYLLPAAIVPAFGPDAGFYALAAIGLVGALLAAALRDRFAPSYADRHGRLLWTWTLRLALAATLVTAAAIGAAWAYIEPMGAGYGFAPERVGLALTISLLFQICGSFLVAVAGYRLPFRMTLPTGVGLQGLSLAYLLLSTSFTAFCAALALFGFLWQACLPFAMDLVVEADPSRTTAPLIMPISLAGLSFGPLAASALVGESVAGAFRFSIVGFAVAMAIYLLLFIRSERIPRPASGAPVT